jgi:hypothetical protein
MHSQTDELTVAAIVDAVGSIRQLVRAADEQQRRYLVITSLLMIYKVGDFA